MASPFDALDAAAQAQITKRLGEAITIIGMGGGKYSEAAPDPDRPAQSVQAIIAISPRNVKVADGIQGRSSTGASRNHQNSEVLIPTNVFETLAWRPVQDDAVVIDVGTAKERRFVVSSILPLDHGEVQLLLSEERAQP